MERLSGLDATFLYGETASIHMHTLKVVIVESVEGGAADSYEAFRRGMAERIHLLAPLKRRIVEVPFGLHHPVWIEDPFFDLDFHLRRVAIPAPGTRREMDDLIAEIASHPLSRRHPLWEMWRLEGLASGGIVYVMKLHHAVADGSAAAHLLASAIDGDPLDASEASRVAPFAALPSKRRLLVDALRDHVRGLKRLIPLLLRTFAGLRGLIAALRAGRRPATSPFAGPRTSFNHGLTPARSFASVDLDLEEVRRIKTGLGVTMNDVVLAIVGCGVSDYLAERGEPIDRPLVATVPTATAGSELKTHLSGNRLSNVFASLCTDMEDPLARVRAIHDEMVAAKEVQDILGKGLMLEWSEYTPAVPYRWMVRAYAGSGLAGRHRPAANLIVSNVRGPAEELKVDGYRLRDLYSVGPIVEGIGLNVTAWSYAGRLAVSVLGCADVVAEPHRIAERIREASARLDAEVAASRSE